jgi:hypothetical protein
VDEPEARPRPLPTIDDAGTVEFRALGINELVSDSQAAVVVKVQEVGKPRWNSADGEPWSALPDTPESYTIPMRYRDATVTVTSVIYDSKDLQLKEGDTTVIRLYGAGEPGGATVDLPYATTTWNQIGGHVSAGDTALVVLARRSYPMREGLQEQLVVVGHYQGSWRVVDGIAVSDDPQRSVSLADLSHVLDNERLSGKRDLTDEQNRATVRDPLAPTPDPVAAPTEDAATP